jgi:hypothetical protein
MSIIQFLIKIVSRLLRVPRPSWLESSGCPERRVASPAKVRTAAALDTCQFAGRGVRRSGRPAALSLTLLLALCGERPMRIAAIPKSVSPHKILLLPSEQTTRWRDDGNAKPH